MTRDSRTALRLVYLTGRGHSGSTLTEMLLGAHSQVCALGELKQLSARLRDRCGCGVAPLVRCRFWRAVDRVLRERHGLSLAALEIESPDDAIFAAHNRALLDAAATVSGARVLTDSSKGLQRLQRLVRVGIAVEIVHLVRSPYGVVHSQVRRGRDWRRYSRGYTLGMAKTRSYLRDRPFIPLRYERLARRPRRELARLMRALGLGLEEAQLRFAEQELHTCAGNAMRFERDATIRVDRSWLGGLSWRQLVGVSWWTLPAQLPGTGLFDAHAPYWKGEGAAAWRVFRRKRALRRRRRWRARLGRLPGLAALRIRWRALRAR